MFDSYSNESYDAVVSTSSGSSGLSIDSGLSRNSIDSGSSIDSGLSRNSRSSTSDRNSRSSKYTCAYIKISNKKSKHNVKLLEYIYKNIDKINSYQITVEFKVLDDDEVPRMLLRKSKYTGTSDIINALSGKKVSTARGPSDDAQQYIRDLMTLPEEAFNDIEDDDRLPMDLSINAARQELAHQGGPSNSEDDQDARLMQMHLNGQMQTMDQGQSARMTNELGRHLGISTASTNIFGDDDDDDDMLPNNLLMN
jgi:hypothetical protein